MCWINFEEDAYQKSKRTPNDDLKSCDTGQLFRSYSLAPVDFFSKSKMAPVTRISSARSVRASVATSDEPKSDDGGTSENEKRYKTRSGMLVKKRFDCTECQNRYWDYDRLRKHKKVAHSVTFTCELCRKHFSRKDKLKNHLKTVHMATRVTCELCGKNFRKKEKLNKHLLAHLGLSFSCETCGKVFTRKYRLKGHVRWAHLGIGFRCDICGNKFCDKIGLQRHKQAVHQTNQFICELCGKDFARIDSLKKHAQSAHLGVVHTCEICGKNFVRKYILNEHVQSAHFGKTYGCELCPKIFSQNCTLKMHIRTVHMGIRHNCELCGRNFQRKNKLKTHICRGYSDKNKLNNINSINLIQEQLQSSILRNKYQTETSDMVQKKIEISSPGLKKRISVLCNGNDSKNVQTTRDLENRNRVLNDNEYKYSEIFNPIENSSLSASNSAYIALEIKREIESSNLAQNNNECFEIGGESKNINLASDTNVKEYTILNNLEVRRGIENVNMINNNSGERDYNIHRDGKSNNITANNNDYYFPNESHSALNNSLTNKTNNCASNDFESSQDAIINYKMNSTRTTAYCSEMNDAQNWEKSRIASRSDNFNACDFPKQDNFYAPPLEGPDNIANQSYNPAWNANLLSKFPECHNFPPRMNGEPEKYEFSTNQNCVEVFDPGKHNPVIQTPYANPLMCMFCNVVLPDAKSYQYHQRSHFG